MGRIIKAGQLEINRNKPYKIESKQAFPDLKPKKATSGSRVFQALSPELLAGLGEQIKTFETPEAPPSLEDEKLHETMLNEAESLKKTNETASEEDLPSEQEAKKQETLSQNYERKKLELIKKEENLKLREATIQKHERAYYELEKKFHEETAEIRKNAEAEAANTLKIAKEAAASIMESAKAEAEAIKKTIKIEEESVKEKAYKEGYFLGEEKGIEAGEEQGRHEAELDFKSLMQEADMLIKEIQSSRAGILKSAEEDMIKLVSAFAKAILKTEPQFDRKIVLNNLDAALAKLSQTEKLTVRINIKDKAMCKDHKDKFMTKLTGKPELEIVEDPGLLPGGIRLETSSGAIDATIETQTAKLEEALFEAYRLSMEQ